MCVNLLLNKVYRLVLVNIYFLFVNKMPLNRRLKTILNLKLYVTMKRFLALKPPRTRSKTETPTKYQDCLKATAYLAVVETAEHDTEAVSHKTRSASNHESNKLIKFNSTNSQ